MNEKGKMLQLQGSGKTITVDRSEHIIRVVEGRNLFSAGKVQVIPFENLVAIRLNGFRNEAESWLEIVTKDNDIVAFPNIKSLSNQDMLAQVCEITGVRSGFDTTKIKIYRTKNSLPLGLYSDKQKMVTHGVHAYALRSPIANASYWLSPDLRLNNSFLWINYQLSINSRTFFTKYPRRSDLPSVEAQYSYWRFVASNLPNFVLAEMHEEFDGAGDTHFEVIAINPSAAETLISAAAKNLLWKWSQQHPYQIPPKDDFHRGQDSLTIMINSTGIHIIMVLLNTAEAKRENELLELGVSFMKTQSML